MKPDLKIIYILLSILIGFSCIQETDDPGITPDKADKEIHFTILLPSSPEGSRSRSITGTEENYISSLYILSFKENNNTEKFDYWCEASQNEGNTNGTASQHYSATLRIRNHNQRLVLLANISDQLKQKIQQGNWEGVEKEEMLAGLEEIMNNPDNKWNTTSQSDYRALPMWGESVPVMISNNTTSLPAAVLLLRMLARIDVQLDESKPGLTDKFRLGSVRLYNTNKKGSLVPAANNIQVVPDNIAILSPTIPAEIAGYSERHFGPVVYDDDFSHAIYLFETEATTSRAEATCLVIGGYYNNEPEQTYYRVDFVSEDGQEPLHILRNHKYTINIVEVKQSGYKNPGDAFHSKGEDMEVSILHWNEIDIDEIWFDAIYYYSVSPRLLEKQGPTSTGNRIRVETDYPEWSYKVSHTSDPSANSAGVNWMNVTSHQAGQKYPGNGIVDFIVFNVGSSDANIRTGYIHVTAGRVTMTVTVKQTYWSQPTFTVSPFGIIPPNGQQRTVRAITGTFAVLNIRIRESYYNSILRTGEIRNGVNNNSVDLIIPAWPETNRIRQVYIEYHNPVTDSWIVIREDTQRSYYWD